MNNKYRVLYNPHAGNNNGEADTKKLETLFPDDSFTFCDMTKITDYSSFLNELEENEKLLVSGGDGTLNRFVNDTIGADIPLSTDIYYYATGSGNDFLNDLGKHKGNAPINISKYLKNLPSVIVNGKKYLFINGIGFGIDGYCCEEGDIVRKKSTKPVNYTLIAIKGLLFHYKPTNAKITVDGVTKEYKKVWLAPTMHGRFYGGGMMPTPEQDRTNTDKPMSTLVMYGLGKLRTLILFPSIFSGAHVKYTKNVKIFRGKKITVEFDRPVAAQIDGETIIGVTRYDASAPVNTPDKNIETETEAVK